MEKSWYVQSKKNTSTAVIELVDRDEDAKGKDSGPVIKKKSTEEAEDQPQV